MVKKSKEEKAARDWKNEVNELINSLAMQPNKPKYDLIMLLEDDEYDRPFWAFIVASATKKRPCTVSLACYEVGTTIRKPSGSSEVMKFKDEVNDKLIVCRDSDNLELYENKDKEWLNKPFIYQYG